MMGHTSVPITYTSGEQVEVYRFSLPVTIGVPLLALFLQAFIPRRFPFFLIFDLPLLVTIFFAMARRNPISGLLTGAVIGLVQDAIGSRPIGASGLAKTVGLGASPLGASSTWRMPEPACWSRSGFTLPSACFTSQWRAAW